MSYSNPLFALIGILGFVVWTVRYFKLFKKVELFGPFVKKKKSLRTHMLYLVGLVGWLFISFSMMGPREEAGYSNNNIKVNDIFFVVDVSRSMLAEDFRPNRLEVAKEKIKEFVTLRPTDRIGLIMFSERAFTLLPLTTDLKLVNKMVDDIKVSSLLGMGTNIGDALALAVGRAAQSITLNKFIVLLTDGVSMMGTLTPIQAAEKAKDKGVKVYTIGMGKLTNDKMLKMGNRYQNIPGGSVDIETLKTISKLTNGKSFYASDTQALKSVLEEIQTMEKIEIKKSGMIIYKEKFWIYYLLGLSLILLVEGINLFWLKDLL